MKSLCEKVQKLLPKLMERGTVHLFALFERDDAQNKWDVVLSSSWSDADPPAAVRYVADLIVPALTADELTAVSRVVVFPSNAREVAALTAAVTVDAGLSEVVDCHFMGLQIKHGYIFRAQRPAAAEAIGQRAAPFVSGAAQI